MKETFKVTGEKAKLIREASRSLVMPENYIVALKESEVAKCAQDIAETGDFIFDVETSGTSKNPNPWRDKLLCISVYTNDTAYLFPFEHQLMPVIDMQMVRKHMKNAFRDPDIMRTNHNIKFDMHFIEQKLGLLCGRAYLDTWLQSLVINPESDLKHGLKELCAQYQLAANTGNYTAQFGRTSWAYIEPKVAAYYAMHDCQLVEKLAAYQNKELAGKDKVKLRSILWNMEMPMLNLLFEMEREGVLVDQKYFDTVLRPTVYNAYELAVKPLRPYIEPYLKVVGKQTVEEVLESPTKLSTVFFDHLNVPERKFITLRRNKDDGGAFTLRSLDKEAITGLRKEVPVMALLGEYRKWTTVKKMFVDNLWNKVDDNHLHATMNSIGTSTGRMSLRNPNLQQIPSRMGPLVRNLFIPEPGYIFMSADFSGQEMRILAHFSGDPKLTRFYTHPNGLDVYSQTAIDAFDEDDFRRSGTTKALFAVMPKNERKHINVYTDAKSLILGLGYGMREAKYARSTGKLLKDGKKDFQAYHAAYPGVGEYQKWAIEQARENGFIETLAGRRRYLPNIYSTADSSFRLEAERAAINQPIQGTAADMVKKASLRVKALIDKHKWPMRIVLLVHDEIVFEVLTSWAQANKDGAIKEIGRVMCSSLPLDVPMESSTVFETRWGSERDLSDLDETDDDFATEGE